MSTFIILLLVAMGIVAIYLARQSGTGSRAGLQSRSLPLDIRNVRTGGIIHLSRVGPEMEDMDVEIVGRHTYREDGFEWYELEGESAAGKVWIEVEDDDELEVSVGLKALKLGDIGVTAERVAEIERRDSGSVEYGGRSYEYEDCGEAEFFRNGDRDNRERLRYWDFEASDGKWFIGVELWGEREYQVHWSQALSSSQIEVYSLGGEPSAE